MRTPFEAFGAVFVLFLLAFAAMVVFSVVMVVNATQNREKTKQEYQLALDQYRSDPTNQGLRQSAMEAGRNYSRYTRNGYGNAFFGEAAIRNDLDSIAATAPAMAEPPKVSIEGRLKTLEGLWTQGLITEDEYRNRRSAILNEV